MFFHHVTILTIARYFPNGVRTSRHVHNMIANLKFMILFHSSFNLIREIRFNSLFKKNNPFNPFNPLSLYQNNVGCACSCLMRFTALSKYSLFSSKPMKCRCSLMQAMAVVPLPIVASRITPPSLL